MLTVGQINEKISLLRSKIAVTQGVVLYLKTHYMPSDGTTAEMHFTRSDYGKVPPEHVEATIADHVNYLDTLKHELDQWENTPVGAPEPSKIEPGAEPVVVTPAADPVPPPAPPAPPAPAAKVETKTNGNGPPHAPAKTPAPATRKEASSGTQRTGSDQPAPAQQAAGGKAG